MGTPPRLSWFDENRAKEHEERAEMVMYVGLAAAGLTVFALWLTGPANPAPFTIRPTTNDEPATTRRA